MRSRGILAAVLLVAVHALQAARAAEDLVVEAQRQGDSVELRARAMVAAPPSLAWEVLTDYEGLPRFIPGISKSIVRSRQEGRVVVDQAGEARFLVFAFPLDVRLEVTEAPPGSVASRAVAGNLRRMIGRYEIQSDSAGKSTHLRYDGLIEPDFDLPPLIGVAAMRSMVQEQFTAMVAEIERRAAALGRK